MTSYVIHTRVLAVQERRVLMETHRSPDGETHSTWGEPYWLVELENHITLKFYSKPNIKPGPIFLTLEQP